MILPPLPELERLGWDYDKGHDGVEAYGYTSEQMCKYALLAIKTVCGSHAPKKHRGPKFNAADVAEIRTYARYKDAIQHFDMSSITFYNIKGHKGAYK